MAFSTTLMRSQTNSVPTREYWLRRSKWILFYLQLTVTCWLSILLVKFAAPHQNTLPSGTAVEMHFKFVGRWKNLQMQIFTHLVTISLFSNCVELCKFFFHSRLNIIYRLCYFIVCYNDFCYHFPIGATNNKLYGIICHRPGRANVACHFSTAVDIRFLLSWHSVNTATHFQHLSCHWPVCWQKH